MSANNSIRFIYFDLGNVLLNFSHEIACRNMAALAGVSPDLVRQLVFEAELEFAYERGDLTTEQFYEHFCTGTGARPELAALCRASSNIFDLNEAILPILQELRARQWRLGILSNTCMAHWDYCTANYGPLLESFEVQALSFQLRSMKPEPAIYRAAAQLAAVEPQQIFFTDDRPENVQGALEAGFDAVLFHSAEQLAAELTSRQLLDER